MKRTRSKGFTLTEVMISVVISIIIFAALSTLLTRCFSLWVDAQAQWKLAQHARVARTRILDGAFGIGTGILCSTNISVSSSGDETEVLFYPAMGVSGYSLSGMAGSGNYNLEVKNNNLGTRVYAHTVARVVLSDPPVVFQDNFSAVISNSVVRLAYTLHLSAMGRKFELPQVVEAVLVNE